MIKYNFRYRGQYEKDKFALSILNFANEVTYMIEEIKEREDYQKELEDIINKNMELNTYYESYRRGVVK